MNKQEEIREGIAREYFAAIDEEYREGDGKRSIFVDQVLRYLHSQGVVIVKDWRFIDEIAVEPIIEESNAKKQCERLPN